MYAHPQEALKKFEKERDELIPIKKQAGKRLTQVYKNINSIKCQIKHEESLK